MKSKKAFTLIELLVVIAIIGLLATIAVIALNNARAKGRDAKRVADIKQIQTALELYFNDRGHYPTVSEFNSNSIFSTSTNGTTTYMAIVPAAANPPDGNCDANQNAFLYSASSDGVSYTISFCTGNTVGSLASGGPKCATPAGMLNVDCCGGDISYGGELYPTIKIGNQCWLAKNLNIGGYIGSGSSVNGYDTIASTTDDCVDISTAPDIWSCQGASGIQKYCYGTTGNQGGNPADCITDGGLYEWAEAMGLPYYCNYTTYTCGGATCISTEHSPDCDYPNPAAAARQGICPAGWHIPGFAELQTLAQNPDPGCDFNCDSGCSCATAGGKLKAASSHTPIAWDGTDDYDFSALPAGQRDIAGPFYNRGLATAFWSSALYSSPDGAWVGVLGSGGSDFGGYDTYRAAAYSVRCVRD